MKALSKIFRGLGLLMILLVVAVYLPVAVPPLLGYEVSNIVSGSMEPAIPVGSLIIYEPAEAQTLEAGEVAVFDSLTDGMTVTHRVVENDAEAGELVTKGDANEANDPMPVAYSQVRGRVLFHIPVMGFAAAIVTSSGGKIGSAALLIAAVLLRIIGARLRPDESDDESGEEST